jgi:hypothetical protein
MTGETRRKGQALDRSERRPAQGQAFATIRRESAPKKTVERRRREESRTARLPSARRIGEIESAIVRFAFSASIDILSILRQRAETRVRLGASFL